MSENQSKRTKELKGAYLFPTHNSSTNEDDTTEQDNSQASMPKSSLSPISDFPNPKKPSSKSSLQSDQILRRKSSGNSRSDSIRARDECSLDEMRCMNAVNQSLSQRLNELERSVSQNRSEVAENSIQKMQKFLLEFLISKSKPLTVILAIIFLYLRNVTLVGKIEEIGIVTSSSSLRFERELAGCTEVIPARITCSLDTWSSFDQILSDDLAQCTSLISGGENGQLLRFRANNVRMNLHFDTKITPLKIVLILPEQQYLEYLRDGGYVRISSTSFTKNQETRIDPSLKLSTDVEKGMIHLMLRCLECDRPIDNLAVELIAKNLHILSKIAIFARV